MLKRIFDTDPTVKHVSYRELKRQYKERTRKADLVFLALLRVSLYAAGILAVLMMISQQGPKP